ncbi:hypothetical protein [Labedaea rhizosphaerae]|uniref:CHAT domain-containing protein n=1 Tax=Labedaea rhizosphaerae TaxID=598644 RepID=A0A4R6SI81_LABRH|nr:hypothetical protein [Labedaea rhizosphaerae]TDQ00579.1 hypothetical protein EV186_102440 [Labedaea rhizosphaerae]
MTQPEIEHEVRFDATAGFRFTETLRASNRPRDLNLIIEPDGSTHRLKVQTLDPELRAAFGDKIECVLPLTVEQLWGHVQECRDTWHTTVIDHQSTSGELVFQRYWDMVKAPQHLTAVLRPIAEAGSKLFLAIFQPDIDDGSQDVSVRKHIFTVLREHTVDRPLWIRCTSSRFFAPWNLIYCRKVTDDPIDPTGFWGYQHVVEHIPRDGSVLAHDLQQPGDEPLRLGINIDPGLDQWLEPLGVECLRPVLEQFESYHGVNPQRREYKAELAEAFKAGIDDHVLYFCCHAEQEGDQAVIVGKPGRLRLGDTNDDGWILPSDITLWTDGTDMARKPVVFLNACAGGQFNSVFYQGFGDRFLAKGACSVIGPQTDLPAVFGGAFARQFFARFFAGSQDNKVGTVLAELRRTFFDQYKNPLGMLYSLYRGADMFLDRAVN